MTVSSCFEIVEIGVIEMKKMSERFSNGVPARFELADAYPSVKQKPVI